MTNLNPLLEPSRLAHGAPPFNLIKTEHFMPALEAAIKTAQARLEAIKSNPSPATFENTIVALETACEEVDYVSTIFFGLLYAEADDKMHALAKEYSPRLASHVNDILLDARLFARVRQAYETIDCSGMRNEEKRLIDEAFDRFKRNGALLSPEQKDRLRQIDQTLAKLSPQFAENVQKATNAFELHISNPADLAGLPDSALEASAAEAKRRGKSGWIFGLQVPSYLPFITFSERRDLREKIWRAYNTRCLGGEFDNTTNILESVRLRNERANLLGYKTHAEYTLQKRMAQSAESVKTFLEQLRRSAGPAAQRELKELAELNSELSQTKQEIMPWDYAYLAEKLKQKKYNLNQEELRPYFKLDSVIAGMFEVAAKLYSLEFNLAEDLPVYHPEVKVYRVNDQDSGKFTGLFYADFFPRPNKKPGAWMENFREQGLMFGEVQAPLVGICCNFSQPTPNKPSLLTFEEVRTLFHEFGHALHGLLSNCTYRSLGGVNVYWDFVELPSQIMENWVYEPEALKLFAKHFETQAVIPNELIERIKAAARFQAGYMTMRQVGHAELDMAWHTADPASIKDILSFEDEALKPSRILPSIPGTAASTSFSHLFAGGYSAGYYSYHWAEVLDADAFELFKEKGIFDRPTAQKFRQEILSRGGTELPMQLYKNFRGREPDSMALLRRKGLVNQ